MCLSLLSVSSPAEQLSNELQWEQRNVMPVALFFFFFLRNLSINFYYDGLLNELFNLPLQ